MGSEGKKNSSKLNAPGRIFALKKQKPKTYFPKIRPDFRKTPVWVKQGSRHEKLS